MIATEFGNSTAEKLRGLQDKICEALAREDGKPFREERWQREEGGGGISRVLEQGNVFEKGAVLFSGINGANLPEFVTRENPGIQAGVPFFASGLSLILHPENPYVPTVHFNVRYFEVGPEFWFGGGMDLTPYYADREDCIHFHRTLKACCDRFDENFYKNFKPACDRYFYLKHRGEARGVGGIFFNYLREERGATQDFILALGEAFLEAYLPIVQRRRATPFGERERAFQCHRRGRYVEFNLLYDQGTLFGLQSGGRIESILASLPPVVNWSYNWKTEPGSPEERLSSEFLLPTDWASLTE